MSTAATSPRVPFLDLAAANAELRAELHEAAASVIDAERVLLGPRLEAFEFNRGGYQTLSFVPSLATMIFGLMAGELLRGGRSGRAKFCILVAAGFLGLASGYALHAAGISPLVKRIWTPSWTLYSTGWACLMLAGFYGVIELAGLRRWAFPLVVIGMNAITIYVLNRFIPFFDISKSLVGGLAGHLGSAGPLVVQFTAVLLAWLLLYHLYRQKIFLRI